MDDVIEHDVIDMDICKRHIKDEWVVLHLANKVQDSIWQGDNFGNIFSDAVEEAAEELEQIHIKSIPDKELPLIDIGSLKSEESKSILEKRLKGESI